MSEHHHDHEHEHHDHEKTSIEEAGGCAVGLTGKINCYNADAEARFAKALLTIGEWVQKESGCLLGHIKAAITLDDGTGITLNLTDLENGVEHHGTLDPQERVNFTFMCAVLDVDEHELRHRMYHAIDDSGLDYELDEHVECHCHDHDHHHDHDHDHDHEHGHHHHHDGEECHCHDHEHHHHDHDHDHGDGHGHEHHHDGECHCAECEAKKKEEQPTKEKKSLFGWMRRKKE
ncbi:MAG: hydrogenase nickel incorporation protein HypA [Candidatus Methanomethylophilaceae archaeon]